MLGLETSMTRLDSETNSASPAKASEAQPASLRERKKERQRAELLRIGAELFRTRGYEEARMEDIAAQAEVSAKTVYNYFPSKQRLLVEFLNQDRLQQRDTYERVVMRPPADPAEALAQLILADVGDVRTVEDKRLWRELLAAATRGHDGPDDDFVRNQEMFTSYIEQLLRHFVQSGALSKTLAVRVAAEIVYALNAYDFREYCASAEMTADDLMIRARKQMRTLVSNWKL